MMERRKWDKKETIIALALYSLTPFGKIHHHNPDIIHVADKLDRTPSALAMKMSNLASFDPKIFGSGRTGLGNASTMDKLVWDQYSNEWENVVELAIKYLPIDISEAESEIKFFSNNEMTTAFQKIKVRKKQEFFRKSILSSYQQRCCISGLSHPKLLVASHIVPWRTDPANRLNPRNGLCLSVLYDKVFDLGFITILPNYTIRVSEQFRHEVLDQYSKDHIHSLEGKIIELPKKFIPSVDYLTYHRINIFQR